MEPIVVDDELRSRLNGLARSTEFQSPDGTVLGYFITDQEYQDLVHTQAMAKFSPEDIERLRKQSGGRKLNDILHDLEQRS